MLKTVQQVGRTRSEELQSIRPIQGLEARRVDPKKQTAKDGHMGQNLLPGRYTGKGEEYYFLDTTELLVPQGIGRVVPDEDFWVL